MTRAAVVTVAAVAVLGACDRETRHFGETPSGADALASVRMSDVAPGGSRRPSYIRNRYEDNAYALAQGKRLFHWYNCDGCHAEGGGGSGPALMDAVWIYGSDPPNVFATIVQGRPNGMPAFGGRIPESEIWELVGYVRSMSGLVSQQVAPNRADAIHAKKPESNTDEQPPVGVSTPTP